MLFRLAQVGIDAYVVLTLVFTQVEDFKGAVVLSLGLQLPLDADQPLAGGVNTELAQVTDDPLTPQFLRYRRRGAGAAEEIGDQVAFVGRCFDDPLKEGFGLLGGIVKFSSAIGLI